jgi:hypothetical protein
MNRPVVILSSWSSGSPLVAGVLGECGGYLCPPFAKSIDANHPVTYESEMFRGMVSATVNEYTFEFKVDPLIFRNGFNSWYKQQLELAEQAGAQTIILNHPLSVFLLDEICQFVDPLFVLITRSFEKIEQTRIKQNLPATYGREGAQRIYERAYSYLHDHEKNFLSISFRNFAGSYQTRLKLVDFLDLEVPTDIVERAFNKVFPTANE